MDVERILSNAKTIAIVNCSSEPMSKSYTVAKYLKDNGYKIIPINSDTDEILGEKCYPSVDKIPNEIKIDIIDTFESDAIPQIVDQAIFRNVKTIWMEEGIVNLKAKNQAEKLGIRVFMNVCLMKEHKKLS